MTTLALSWSRVPWTDTETRWGLPDAVLSGQEGGEVARQRPQGLGPARKPAPAGALCHGIERKELDLEVAPLSRAQGWKEAS